jgi:hypothetical protein
VSNTLATVFVAAAWAALSCGCATEKACENYCSWAADCALLSDLGYESQNSCENSCDDDFGKASNTCQKAFVNYSDCTVDHACDAFGEGCEAQIAAWTSECGGSFDG